MIKAFLVLSCVELLWNRAGKKNHSDFLMIYLGRFALNTYLLLRLLNAVNSMCDLFIQISQNVY